jgi:hypothetical protein
MKDSDETRSVNVIDEMYIEDARLVNPVARKYVARDAGPVCGA